MQNLKSTKRNLGVPLLFAATAVATWSCPKSNQEAVLPQLPREVITKKLDLKSPAEHEAQVESRVKSLVKIYLDRIVNHDDESLNARNLGRLASQFRDREVLKYYKEGKLSDWVLATSLGCPQTDAANQMLFLLERRGKDQNIQLAASASRSQEASQVYKF